MSAAATISKQLVLYSSVVVAAAALYPLTGWKWLYYAAFWPAGAAGVYLMATMAWQSGPA
jgi:hypothetical protein